MRKRKDGEGKKLVFSLVSLSGASLRRERQERKNGVKFYIILKKGNKSRAYYNLLGSDINLSPVFSIVSLIHVVSREDRDKCVKGKQGSRSFPELRSLRITGNFPPCNFPASIQCSCLPHYEVYAISYSALFTVDKLR